MTCTRVRLLGAWCVAKGAIVWMANGDGSWTRDMLCKLDKDNDGSFVEAPRHDFAIPCDGEVLEFTVFAQDEEAERAGMAVAIFAYRDLAPVVRRWT